MEDPKREPKESERTKQKARMLETLAWICPVVMVIPIFVVAVECADIPGAGWIIFWLVSGGCSGGITFFFFSQLLHIRAAAERIAEK